MTDHDAYIDAASALVGLPIAPAHRPGVATFLAIAADMAALVNAAPLDEAEQQHAPTYLPPEARK
ncbi:MAG: hypothetical protein ACJA1L_001024 [Paracoccaceae bacterium]|jgi:hypothetical protein